MKHKRTSLTIVAAAVVLTTTAGAAWYTTLDTPAGDGPPSVAHGLCLPATDTDEDRAGYARTIALVTVDRSVEYRKESADPGGALVSAVTVAAPLKGAPPKQMTIGQSVLREVGGGYARTKATYLPLEPGHQYVVGIVPDSEYGDGWVWFATAADTDPAATTARWTRAVDRQIAPHPDPACTDVILTPAPAG